MIVYRYPNEADLQLSKAYREINNQIKSEISYHITQELLGKIVRVVRDMSPKLQKKELIIITNYEIKINKYNMSYCEVVFSYMKNGIFDKINFVHGFCIYYDTDLRIFCYSYDKKGMHSFIDTINNAFIPFEKFVSGGAPKKQKKIGTKYKEIKEKSLSQSSL